MFEDVYKLSQLETILRLQMGSCTFLGQIDLTREDFTKLEKLVKEKLGTDISLGTEYLEKRCPTCFAVFLVWEGIYKYHEGKYWSAIADTLDVDISAWQTRWGEFFLDFLKSNKLPLLNIEGSRRYVTPILLHAGIPLNCAEGFFNHAVWPLVKDGITHINAVEAELTVIRSEYQSWHQLNKELDDLKHTVITLKQSLKRLRVKDTILKLRLRLVEMREFLETNQEVGKFPFSIIQKRADLLSEIQRNAELLAKLHGEKKSVQAQIRKLGNTSHLKKLKQMLTELLEAQNKITNYRRALGEINDYIKTNFKELLNVPWQEEYSNQVINISCDNLEELTDQSTELEAKLHELKVSERELEDLHGQRERTTGLTITGIVVAILLGITGALTGLPALWLLAVGLSATSVLGIKRVRENNRVKDELNNTRRKIRENEVERTDVVQEIKKLFAFVLRSDISQIYLTSLPVEVSSLQAKIKEKLSLDKECSTLNQTYREIMNALQGLELNISENFDQSILCELNKDYDERLNKLEIMNKKLDVIDRKIEQTDLRKLDLENSFGSIDKSLANLVANSIEQAIQLIQKYWGTVTEKKEIENQLQDYYHNWPGLMDETDDERHLPKVIEQNNEKSRKLQQEIERSDFLLLEKEKELETLFPVLQQLEEPVKRFLVHGREIALKQLVTCVSLVGKAQNPGNISNPIDDELPIHIKEALSTWWEVKSADRQTAPTKAREFSAATCFLNPVTPEIYLHFPTQLLDEPPCNEHVLLKLRGAGGEQLNEVPLRLFRGDDNYLQTEVVELELTAPEEIIELILTDGEKTFYHWQRSGINKYQPYLIFNYDTNRLVSGRYLPRKTLWFIIPTGASIEPRVPIYEEIAFHGKWNGYKGLAVSTENEDLTVVKIIDDKTHELFISSENTFEPILTAGNKVMGVTAQGEETYAGQLPSVQFNFTDKQQLSNWRISIHSRIQGHTENFAPQTLEEAAVETYVNNKLVLEVKLSDIIQPNEIDLYQIYLRGPANKKYTLCFGWMVQLDYKFSRDLYFPVTDEIIKASLDVLIPQDCTYSAYEPSCIDQNNGNLYRLVVGHKEDYFRGRVIDSFGRFIDLQFKIPKIKWRFVGNEGNRYSSWSDKIEEIWVDELLNASKLHLIVAVPIWLSGTGRLVLGAGLQEEAVSVNNGIIKFDLLKYGDSLLLQKSAVQKFSLSLHSANGTFTDIELFNVKTKWLVHDLTYTLAVNKDETILDFTWDDAVQPLNRVMEIRGLLGTERHSSKIIDDGTNSVQMKLAREMFPPSLYLIQFFIDDPWSSTVKAVEKENKFILPILDGAGTYLNNCSVAWLGDNKLDIKGRLSDSSGISSLNLIAMGMQDGLPEWKVKTVTVQTETGNFEGTLDMVKGSVHWLCIMSPEDTAKNICWVGILNDACMLEIPINEQIAHQVEDIIDGILQIKLKSDKGSLGQSELKDFISTTILQYLSQGKELVNFSHVVDGNYQKVKLKRDSTGFKVCYDKGVVCTTCRRIFPNHEAWFRHNPRQKCHGLETNVNEIDVEAVIVWDYKKLQKAMPKYIYPDHDSFSGINMLLSEAITNDQAILFEAIKSLCHAKKGELMDVARQVTLLLWQQELNILKLLVN